MLETLDAAAVHRWCGGGLEALRAHQHEIDELNVYPVPDGDTGTNLVLTMAAAQEALDRFRAEHPEVAAAESQSAEAQPAESQPAESQSAESQSAEAQPAGARPAESQAAGAQPAGAHGGEVQTAEAHGGEALGGEVLDPAEAPVTALGRAMRRMARGALLGARGNSGVIVSQILRGMADTFATPVTVRGGELARALRTATEAAYGAVARPVEGTVLSVVAAAADGAGRIKSDDLLAVARAAAGSAREALARTPQQLPALARAGVVDAGGRGLCLLLDALVEALGTRPGPDAPTANTTAADPSLALGARAGSDAPTADTTAADPSLALGVRAGSDAAAAEVTAADGSVASAVGGSKQAAFLEAAAVAGVPSRGARAGERGHEHDGEGEFGYEVQYLLDAADAAVDRLRSALDAMGDSLVVVGTGDGDLPTWNVHVHVPADRIGPAVEAGIGAGRPYQIKVTPLDDRVAERRTREGDHRGAVVVAAGDGLTALFEAEGAIVVGRNPSTAEMLAAITAADARSVVLLPNDADTHAVATTAAREAERAGLRVSVVPTRSPVQALAALAVRDDGRAFADDVIAMAEAAGACRYGEVCTAQRAAFTVAGPCREGDLLGLVDGEVHVIGTDLEDVSLRLLDRMLGGGGELATLVLGADAPDALDGLLRAHVTQTWPFVELQSYAGGQPRYHLLVGVE
ncbi:MAG TPA: DAK2 domain-containing protein [Actinoplanes sp.]